MDTDVTSQPSPEATAGTAKKYIRTLAGDMEIVKKGGTPDLVPLVETKSSPAERLVAASPITPPPVVPTPELPTNPQPVVSFQPAEPASLQTYASDFSDRMKETNASTATVLAAEQDATPPAKPQSKPRSSLIGFFYIFAGAILFFASGFGAYFVYAHYFTELEPIISAPLVSAPIFVDEREQVSGVGAVLISAIEQSIDRPLASDTVRLIYSENATSTDNSIFSALQIPAPNILLRNIQASDSMAGVVNISGSQSPFFILSVSSYNDTFSGMLSWEPVMAHDLEALFPPYTAPIDVITATSTLATTTPKIESKAATTTTATSSVKAIAASFRDEVVSNHDARVYRDSENRSILMYGYWDQTTLVIARDPAAFSEILRRLASSRTPQ